jgi:hypothetical protein
VLIITPSIKTLTPKLLLPNANPLKNLPKPATNPSKTPRLIKLKTHHPPHPNLINPKAQRLDKTESNRL